MLNTNIHPPPPLNSEDDVTSPSSVARSPLFGAHTHIGTGIETKWALMRKKPKPRPPSQPLRCLVTGGAGFIGAHLCKKLVEEGNDVICMDNYFSGCKHNVYDLLKYPNFELMRHDVTQEYQVEVDQIYHLACPASPAHYQYNAIRTIKTSVIGTMNSLGVAKRCNARLLLASTSEVYGDPEIHPQVEEYNGNVNPVGLRSCYDEGKRVAETLCMDYLRQHNVDTCIARIFNTYGPLMFFNDGRVVSNFIVQALRGDALTVYGDGQQTRSFIYVDDLVDGLIKLMNNGYNGPVNVGNPTEFTIKEVADFVREIVDPNLEIQYRTLPNDDPRRRQPDITKARNILGWEPKVEFKEGLRKTVLDFKMRSAGMQQPSFEYVHQNEATLLL